MTSVIKRKSVDLDVEIVEVIQKVGRFTVKEMTAYLEGLQISKSSKTVYRHMERLCKLGVLDKEPSHRGKYFLVKDQLLKELVRSGALGLIGPVRLVGF